MTVSSRFLRSVAVYINQPNISQHWTMPSPLLLLAATPDAVVMVTVRYRGYSLRLIFHL